MLREKILSFIRANGPVLPVQVSKQFGGDLMFSGAVLSELVGKKAIMISTAKIGGSPVYYVNGQEGKLEILYPHLRDVHKRMFDLLKEEKVLKDNSLEAWQRVALRELKDFAYPIQKEDGIYWRWHLTRQEEALRLIDDRYKVVQEKIEEVQKLEEPTTETREIIKKEEHKWEIVQPKIEKKERKQRIKKDINIDLTNYFSGKGATVIEERVIRKNSESEYVVEIPSNVGKVKFFVKVRNKKTISDADIVLAHNDAQLRKLPLLFLSTGELNKKAEEYISKNSIKFEKI